MTLREAREFLTGKRVFVKNKGKEVQENFLISDLNGLPQRKKESTKIDIFYFFMRI